MIDSVDRIVHTPIRECPPLVEGIIGGGIVLATVWFQVEPVGDDWFRITEVEAGASLQTRGDTIVSWLKPEDMNDPAIQAELIVGLAQMGLEL